jgi:hypothetical protein
VPPLELEPLELVPLDPPELPLLVYVYDPYEYPPLLPDAGDAVGGAGLAAAGGVCVEGAGSCQAPPGGA